uniref:Reverse transcriptase domain-containing protein n=1 Tax=Tanacetum cinerariifolium TaxID=118510 RepID=A0A6L2J8K1_TANCI|nr:reverse transcriptase domain-containing protein [Tanacetum cinerariifolium]
MIWGCYRLASRAKVYREPADISLASSAVTYTSVYTDSESGRVFWGADEELSDGEPIYPEYIPLEDEHILPAEEQLLPPVGSPTAVSPGYVTELDLEDDPEEYKDGETEDGPVDYPTDRKDDGDDDDGDSSGDNADDEDEEEEEEHLAPADFAVVIPTNELVSPPERTEPVIPPPSTDTATTGARITVRLQAAISFPPEAEVERLLAMPTPSPSPLTSLSPPSTEERLARCTAPAALPSPSLPLPLHMPPPVDRRDDIPETEMLPHKSLCLSNLGSRYEVGESSTARPTGGQRIDYGFISTLDAEVRRRGIREVRYGIRDTWIDPAETVPDIAHMTVGEDTHILTSHGRLAAGRLTYDGHDSTPGDHTDCGGRGMHQAQMAETPRVMGDMRREIGNMQAELLALRGQPRRAGQPGGDARVKFATCTLLDAALTWMNSQIRSLGPDAYSMTWEVLKKKMTDKYCLQGHPFNIDLMPVELGSFDVIIGMDWLRRCHAMIVCDEKLVRIPYGNETLTFHGNKSNNGRESRLSVISCSKAREYMAKGCQIFLAQISAKKEEDKSEGKQLKDVPVVQNYPKVFPEDLLGLPPARPVEFQIDLILGAAPVARVPYRLDPSEMKELSEQLQELSEKAS